MNTHTQSANPEYQVVSGSNESRPSVAADCDQSVTSHSSVAKKFWFEKDINFPAAKYIKKNMINGKEKSVEKKNKNETLPRLPYNTKIAYKLERSLHWDSSKFEQFSKYHPVDASLKTYDSSNEHPMAASCRNILESCAITMAIKKCFHNGIDHCYIKDVGGSFIRHKMARRDFMHTLAPDLIASDFHRGNEVLMSNVCRHKWQQCTCTENTLSISVHALYYLRPDEIINCISQQRIQTHYAVMHDYINKPSTLFDGEVNILYSANMMQVTAKGNSACYTHEYPYWMNHSGYYNDKVTGKSLHFYAKHRIMDDVLWELTVGEWVYDDSPEFLSDDALTLSVCEAKFKFARVIDKYSVTKFLDDVAADQRLKIVGPYKSRKFALDWFMNHSPVVTSPNFFSMDAEEGIDRINYQLTNLKGIYTWHQILTRHFSKNFYIYAAILFCMSFYYSPLVTMLLCLGYYLTSKQQLSFKYSIIDFCCGKNDNPVDVEKCANFPRYINGIDCKAKVRAFPLLAAMHHLPAYPRNCYHSYYNAITKRMLCPLKVDDSQWDEVYYPTPLLRAAAVARTKLVPLSYTQWLERFPTKKQIALKREKRSRYLHQYQTTNDSKMFQKTEGAKSIDKAARCVISTNEEYTSEVGRWIVPLTAIIGECLDSDSVIFLPLASSAEEIAGYISKFDNFVENDFSSFDSTEGRRALLMVYRFYNMCGVPKEITDLMERDLDDTKISTSVGITFNCKGFRFSGRSDTLLGNTVLNVIIMYHVFKSSLQKMIVKGDDSVIDALPGHDDQAEKILSALGFQAKIRRTNKENVEFCSKLLVPVADGFTMGPKIGRLLAKTFWCRNTNLNLTQQFSQFKGIIKGLEHDISFVPILNKLIPYADVDYSTVNEYAVANAHPHKMTPETVQYYSDRYGISCEDLLAFEFPNEFPILLNDELTRTICDVDWSIEDNAELLSVKYVLPKFDYMAPIYEELVKWFFGIYMALLIGLFESIVHRSFYNLTMHVLLFYLPLPLAILVHAFLNYKNSVLLSLGPAVIHMTKKNKSRKAVGSKKPQQNKQKENEIIGKLRPIVQSALAKGLRAGGASVGNFIAPGVGAGLGYSAGAGISQILGFGDYKVSKNSLTSAPVFGKVAPTFRVKNREFIKDITSSTAFSATNYSLNPGNTSLFPWLSKIASGYQQARINGMVFYFNTTSASSIGSTNTALGSVLLSTNYDTNEPAYKSKAEVLSSYFSSSGSPAEDLIHAIECDPKQRPFDVINIDNGESIVDPTLYNMGNFQLATVGMQAPSNIGELWVSYDITFLKPRLNYTGDYSIMNNGSWTTTSPLGNIITAFKGTQLTVDGSGGFDTIHLAPYIGKTILLTMTLSGTGLNTPVISAVVSGLTARNAFKLFAASTTNNNVDPAGGQVSVTFCYDVTDVEDPTFQVVASLVAGTPSRADLHICSLGSTKNLSF
jgi:hypothetical protein